MGYRLRKIGWLMAVLLMVGGMVSEAWAAKVTYHILTLPIDASYNMNDAATSHRLEAIKVVVDNQTTVELPAQYKSPLAENFYYFAPKDVSGHGSAAVKLFANTKNPNRGVIYDIVAKPDTIREGTGITTSTAEYYVTYTYKASNGIAKLDGTERYNIGIKNKGFLALNRGRNNRPAVVPTAKVSSEMLSGEDFTFIDKPGGGITTYWDHGDNKNKRSDVESQFFFGFTFEGQDPYNIIIRTSYAKDSTYIEKNDGTSNFVYKWYKGGSLFAQGTANSYIASDEHKLYSTPYDGRAVNPVDPASSVNKGNWHGQTGVIWGTVALLNNNNNTGYVLMGTRTVGSDGTVSPPSNNKYNYLKFTGNNLNYGPIDAADATKNHTIEGIYPIKKVTFKIATPFYAVSATSDHLVTAVSYVSQYTVDNEAIDVKYLPESLQRKFCEFTGKFYSDATCETEITKFSDVEYDAGGDGYEIFVGYRLTSTIPFETITPKAGYDSTVWNKATWYELTDEGSTEAYGRKIKYDGSSAYKNNGASGEYVKMSEFAFVGDPYELKVLDRSATTAAPTAGAYVTLSGESTWDIPEDAITDANFLLRKYKGTGHWYWDAGQTSINVTYKSSSSPNNVGEEAQTITINVSGLTGGKYYKITTGGTDVGQIVGVSPEVGSVYPETGTTATITVRIATNTTESSKTMTVTIQEYDDNEGNTASESPATPSVVTITQGTSPSAYVGSTLTYDADYKTRVKVLDLPQLNFTYSIVDTYGNIAIKASVKQTIFSHIAGFTSIPEVIRSPFLADETITYYRTYAAKTCSNKIVETSNTDGDNIYVKYTVDNLGTKSIKLNETQQFKVKLNEEHIYYKSDESKIRSTKDATTDDVYSWRLEGGDPYAMKIRNVGVNTDDEHAYYVKVDGGVWGDDKALDFIEGKENGSGFIAMMSIYAGVYEVLAATGNTELYHIGRPSDTGAETKIYSTSTYAHGADELRFELAGTTAYTYYLIDMAGNDLLYASSFNPRLTLPAEYVSPLVKEYYYYPTKAKALTNLAGDRITEPTQDDGDFKIYVRYIANDVVTFNTGQYMLRFLNPQAEGYYLEDGNDKLIPYDADKPNDGKIQAVYPYCNGDGNLNIYGNDMQKEQFGGGASTRPRWVWYFDSENSDPYHVRIRSKSRIKYKSINHPTYLTTYAVRFNQDGESDPMHIVTGGTLPGVASTNPTEYMVLGTPGNYHLLTTDSIDDGVSKKRCRVDSLEQYWKTYNMIKLHVLGINKNTDAFDGPWEMPVEKQTDLNSALETLHVGAGKWHSYSTYANATRWNGYNDKETGHEKKVVEKLEHWFQTFQMGDGSFDIEDADIPPVLVLLDRHGWEVMRRPLPTNATYPVGEELAELRVYDSPLVDKYYFYSNATKASGCHKYTLRLNDSGEERDQIKVNGKQYSSSSLADLPPLSATGVINDGAIQDFYVTYSVKEEYEHNYAYSLDKSTTPYTEQGKSQPYMVLQNGRFYKVENKSGGEDKSYISKPIFEHATVPNGNIYDLIVSPCNNTVDILKGGKFSGNTFWYVKPNLNIDEEMGIPWQKVTGAATDAAARDTLRKEYEDKMGFDPYNIQLQLKNKTDGTKDGRFLTAHMTSTRLDNGILVGDYSGSGGSTNITLEDSCTSPKNIEGYYDHTTMHVTNQTFMAVSDVNGNMQLMPRFDHTLRVSLEKVNPWHSHLSEPEDHEKASAENNNSMGRQTTFFVCPKRYHYHIIDNNGREALRYERGADFYPEVTSHFKSPLAKNFTYYTGLAESETPVALADDTEWEASTGEFKRTLTDPDMLTDAVKILPHAGTYVYRIGTRGNFRYKSVEVTKGLLAQQVIGSFSDTAKVEEVDRDIYVRYEYDVDADMDADRMLQGQWYTVKLGTKDLQADGKIIIEDNDKTEAVEEVPGTGVNLYTGTKPGTINADAMQWQWKFLAAPTDPSSDYYVEPDPYAVQLFNRHANYTKIPSEEPSPMAVGIRVPNADEGPDRFALLSHPNGGYALLVAKTYTDNDYQFINGANMTAPDAGTPHAADTTKEAGFTYKAGAISLDAQILLGDTVKHTFTYRVITNDSLLAITVTQTSEEADLHRYAPYLPEAAQSPLLNMDDYKYYGFSARPKGKYGVIPQTILYTLSGLYDDTVYVRYNAYDVDKTSFKVPNKKTTVDGKVARHPESVDVSMNINGELPYNIIWEDDNMMKSEDNTTVADDGSQGLSGTAKHIWYFSGGDPYALKIKHKNGGYLDGDGTMTDEAGAWTFMLLRKTGYNYGILQKTNDDMRLTGFGGATTTSDPTKYVIFGLSIHDLIYHLVIAKSCPDTLHPKPGEYVDISYKKKVSDPVGTKRIYGTTQRDLETKEDPGHEAGSKYQLGDTVLWNGAYHTYSHHAGSVSIGDDLEVPNAFTRPNCSFEFYVEGVYDGKTGAEIDAMNTLYRGMKLNKLMSDEGLIDETVVVNIVYSFDNDVATNTGLGFVTSKAQNLWYTYETYDGSTPYLAQYTNAWGLQSKQGQETHYTNDYLWTPLGDVYGFKMYNRYMLKNTYVTDTNKVMTMNYLSEGDSLYLAEPGVTTRTKGASSGTPIPEEYGIFELLTGDVAGYFRVHPVANMPEETQLYVYRDPEANNYTRLSTTPCDWRFGLDRAMLAPYYIAAGYVGGLTPEGKLAYEAAVASDSITNIQKVVYDDANIVQFTSGYYRLHNQPGVSGIDPVRYASGYLHDIEKTAVSGGIPMHFYSRRGVTASYEGKEDGLGTGFTKTNATRGEIPIDSTEIDPSTIFYLHGARTSNTTISEATISTQGLNALGNKMTTGAGTTFTLIDIGGATLLIADKLDPATRQYLNFDQRSSIYDLKFAHDVPTDDAKWCLQPVQKTAAPGDNEIPLQIITHNGGDGYYYTTFYAPFHVLLPNDAGGMTYNAYTCSKWYDDAVHPTPVPAYAPYAEGKFVPAGTPVIIRVKDESGVLNLTLPSIETVAPVSCIFSGEYLEQKLSTAGTHDVYTFGLPITSEMKKDEDDVDPSKDYSSTGGISGPPPDFASTGVGFYINATPNKEDDPWQSLWKRNNRYVLHNRIYYLAPEGVAGVPEHKSGSEYVPVIFDDEDEDQEQQPDNWNEFDRPTSRSQKILYNGQLLILHDGKVYTITGQEVR